MLANIKVGFIRHDYSHSFDFGIALLIVCEMTFMQSKIQVSVLLCRHIIFGFIFFFNLCRGKQLLGKGLLS